MNKQKCQDSFILDYTNANYVLLQSEFTNRYSKILRLIYLLSQCLFSSSGCRLFSHNWKWSPISQQAYETTT